MNTVALATELYDKITQRTVRKMHKNI